MLEQEKKSNPAAEQKIGKSGSAEGRGPNGILRPVKGRGSNGALRPAKRRDPEKILLPAEERGAEKSLRPNKGRSHIEERSPGGTLRPEGDLRSKVAKICGKISEVCLYLLTFLLPIFFLPFTAEVLEFNKQNLLIALSLVALIAWLFKMFLNKKIELVKTPLNAMVLLFVLFYGLAAFFSLDKYQSFVGSYGLSADSFASVFGLAAFFLVSINNLKQLKHIKRLAAAFLASGALAAVFGILQFFGARLLPLDIAQNQTFNTVGTPNALAIFSVVGFCLAVAWLINPHSARTVRPEDACGRNPNGRILLGRAALALAALPMFAVVVLVDFWVAWAGLIAGMALILIFANVRIREFRNVNWLVIPAIILTVSAGLSFVRLPLNLNLPPEIVPSQKTGWRIARSVLLESPVWGSGPGTFAFAYAKYRPITLNETSFWNAKFNQGGSGFLTLLASSGLAGAVAWLLMLFGFLALGVRCFIWRKDHEKWFWNMGIFSVWLLLAIFKFVYPFNLTLEFSFWLLMGFFAAVSFSSSGEASAPEDKRTGSLNPNQSPRLHFLITFFATLLICAAGFALYLAGQRYAAEIYYKKAQLASQQDETLEPTAALLEKAAARNPFQNNLYRDVAQVYLLKAIREIQKITDQSGGANLQNIQIFGQKAILAAKRAAELSPANADNWQMLGDVYLNISPFIQNSDEWAIDSYQKAAALEPNNPLLYVKLGDAYSLKSDLITDVSEESSRKEKEDSLNFAKEKFEKALELKLDYAPAHLRLSFIHWNNNQFDLAVKEIELSKQYAPEDAEIAYHLGALYFQTGETAKSAVELERAIALSPDYADARWVLSSIYEDEGRLAEAVRLLERVAELNPTNEAVKAELEGLRAKLSAPAPEAEQSAPVSEQPTEEAGD